MIHQQNNLRVPHQVAKTETDQIRNHQEIARSHNDLLSHVPWTARLGGLAYGGIDSATYIGYGPRLYLLKEHDWSQLTIDYHFSSYCPPGQAPDNWWICATVNSTDPNNASLDFSYSATGVLLGLIGLDPANDHQSFSLTSGPISRHGDTSDYPLTSGRYAIQTYAKRAGAYTQMAYNEADNFWLRVYEHPPMPDMSQPG